MIKIRLTSAQKKAFEAYKFAERQEDRYLGSVFVTPPGQREHEERTRKAFEECKRLGMTLELVSIITPLNTVYKR